MDIKIYSKKEALILMLSGETMVNYNFNSNFNYYYLDGKFYRSGEGEWNPNESLNDVEWIISQ